MMILNKNYMAWESLIRTQTPPFAFLLDFTWGATLSFFFGEVEELFLLKIPPFQWHQKWTVMEDMLLFRDGSQSELNHPTQSLEALSSKTKLCHLTFLGAFRFSNCASMEKNSTKFCFQRIPFYFQLLVTTAATGLTRVTGNPFDF